MALNKQKVQEKLKKGLLYRKKEAINQMTFKQLVQEYYRMVKGSTAVKKMKSNLKTQAIKKELSETQIDSLIAKKVKKAVLEMIKRMGKNAKKVQEMEPIENEDIIDPAEQEAPVADEFADENIDIEDENIEEEYLDLDEEPSDTTGEDVELDPDMDPEFDFENDIDIEDPIDKKDPDLENDELDLENDELDLENDEGISEEDLNIDLEEEPELTEQQRKNNIRMKRMKAKALEIARKRVSEEETGDPVDGTDPSEGVDATLAGNEVLFDEIPDIDATGLNMDNQTPADSGLGTQDQSTSPNIPAEETDADDWIVGGAAEAEKGIKDGGTVKARGTTENKKSNRWNVRRKEEKLNYKKLMNGDYFKKIQG